MSFYTNALRLPHKFDKPVILDLGANAGIEGEKIFNLHADATLIMVEPIFSNVMQIYNKIATKNMVGKWFVEHCAIDNKCDFLDIMYHMSGAMDSRPNCSVDPFNWKNWSYTHHERVRTKTIKEICPEPNIVKIDIERHEWQVFPSIAQLSSIQAIFLEAHGPCFPLDVVDFLTRSVHNTKLAVTGWWFQDQSQTEGTVDSFREIPPRATIECGDHCYVVIERDES